MFDDAEIARELDFTLSMNLPWLLTGDFEGFFRRVEPGDVGVHALSDALAVVPPLVDLRKGELTALTEESVRSRTGVLVIPFRDVSDRVAMSIELTWTEIPAVFHRQPNLVIALKAVTGHGPAVATRRPDAQGRLPREQFVGSASLRMRRFFNTLRVTGAARSIDIEDAFRLDYADGDIYNGGLEQFYSNSTGDFADRFPELAARVGATRKAEIISASNTMFDQIRLDNREERNARLDALSDEELDRLSGWTDEYYDLDENITVLLAAFVESSPDTFLY